MGSIGDCYDNAMIESFWGRVQTELLDRQRWRTRIEWANALFEYLEVCARKCVEVLSLIRAMFCAVE